jgi:ABC-2 type transport system permease protein
VASVVVYLAIALLGMAILVIVGKIVFGLRVAGSWPNILAAFLLSAGAFFSLGYLIASLVPTARVAQAVGMVVFFPMMFLSGAGLPLQMLPEVLQKVSEFLPLTYVVRLIQGLWFGEAWSALWLPTLVLAGILLAGTALATRFFRWE